MMIAIVGTGYVGLVTGTLFADYGYEVFCIDIDEARIEKLRHGQIPFYEPGLGELVKKNIEAGTLKFTLDYSEAVPHAEAVFICVGTPPLTNGEVDLTQLTNATEMVAKHLKDYTVIAIKSTVPIGVEENLEAIIEHFKPEGVEYEFASVPEFLRESSAVEDTTRPDRLVFGVKSKKAANILLDIHKHISGERIVTDLRSAQMIKYAANSFLAMKISFANGVANVAERTGADAKTVLYGMGVDKRIGHSFFHPGIGFGGSCFPKDVLAFYDIAKKAGYEFDLVKAAYDINQRQIDLTIEKIAQLVGDVEHKTFALLGLAFKPATDDTREAPSLKLIDKLLAMGAKMIRATDPQAIDSVKRLHKYGTDARITFFDDPYEALKGADCMIVVTEWPQYKDLDLTKIKKLLATPNIVDGRNIYDPHAVKTLGYQYRGIGRS